MRYNIIFEDSLNVIVLLVMLLHLRFACARARAQRAANSTCTRCERAREIERLPPTPKMPKTQTKKLFSTFEAEKISQNLSEAKASSKIQETYKESTIFEFFEGGGEVYYNRIWLR